MVALDGPVTVGVFSDAGALKEWNVLAGGAVGRVTSTGAKLYYHTDALGTVRAVADAGGAVTEARDYDPWGLALAGRQTGSGTREGYTGHEYDAETNLNYAGARYYAPALGRWTAVDPLESQFPSVSPYNYALNSPYNLTDPTGLAPEGCCLEEAGAFAGGAAGAVSSAVSGLVTWATSDAPLSEKAHDVARSFAPIRPADGGDPTLAEQASSLRTAYEGARGLLQNGTSKDVARAAGGATIAVAAAVRVRGGRHASPSSRTFQGLVEEAHGRYGGNPTVTRNGRDIVRFRRDGHGSNSATVTPQNVRRVAPNGQVHPGRGNVRAVTRRDIKELYKALVGEGTNSVRTRSGRR